MRPNLSRMDQRMEKVGASKRDDDLAPQTGPTHPLSLPVVIYFR